jgi:hypothetical protein
MSLSDDAIKAEAKVRAKSACPITQNNDPPFLRDLIDAEYALGFEAGARWARAMFEQLDPVVAAFKAAALLRPPAPPFDRGATDPFESEEYQRFVESMAPECHCRSGNCPCDGVLAGGVCDNIQDDPDSTEDDED